MLRSLVVLSLGLFFTSCSNPDLGVGGTQRKEKTGFDRLSKASQEQFDEWEQKTIKSCDAGSIFDGSDQGDEPGVDLKSLFELAGKSYVLKDSNQNFVIFGDGLGFSGEAETRFEQTITVNGKTQSIEASTKRVGSSCQVFVFGKKVYETEIAKQVIVAGHLHPDSEPKSVAVELNFPTTTDKSLMAIQGAKMHDALWASLRPTDQAYETMATYLKVSANEARKYFISSGDSNRRPTTSYKFPEDSLSLDFGDSDSIILGNRQSLETIFKRQGQSGTIEILIKDFEVPGRADPATTSILSAQVSTYSEAGQNHLVMSDIRMTGRQPLSDQTAALCLLDRSELLGSLLDNTAGLVSNPRGLKQTCSVYSADIDKAFYSLTTLQRLFPSVLRHANPSDRYDYNGWDSEVLRVAVALRKEALPIRESLDPQGLAPVIGLVSENFKKMDEELKAYPKLKTLEEALLSTAGSWALYGSRFGGQDAEFILSALNNSVDPFAQSTLKVLRGLVKSPSERPRDLIYAASLSEKLKAAARRSLELAQALSYNKWIDSSFSSSLQEQHGREFFLFWSAKFEIIQKALSPHAELKDRSEELTELALALLEQGYKPNRLKYAFKALANIAPEFPQATDRLIQNLKSNPEAAQEDLDFAHGVTPEYKKRWARLIELGQSLQLGDWLRNKEAKLFTDRYPIAMIKKWESSLVQAQSFSKSEQAKLKDSEGDHFFERNKEALILHALDEIWLKPQYQELQQIAEVVSYNSFCERFNTTSSLINCIGLRHFSTESPSLMTSSHKGRYAELAKVLAQHLKASSAEDSKFFNDGLVRDFLSTSQNYIWKSCSHSNFLDKTKALKKDLQVLRKTKNQSKIWELEREIEISLRDCR